jgi:putative ABC transport system permease protein
VPSSIIAGLVARVHSLWRGIRGHGSIESEMNEEFRHHIELRAADLVRSGVAVAEATRRARLEFGSQERYKDEGRESRGLRRIDALRVSWLDFKLGFRMLARYPGLTLVGGLAMAFAIWAGSATFELVTQVIRPTIPLDEGDRIVGLRNWDADRNRRDGRALHDFVTWRSELKSVTDLGAFRNGQRNLITGEGRAEPVEVTEISASAFSLARVPPLLGRALVAADERKGAVPVAVIGHELWQRRFAGDSTVIGRSVRLGRAQTTIVGVMPAGYEFPVSQSFWVPLRLDPLDYNRRQGPSIQIFGRLAPGASLEAAQSELTAIGQRTAADFPNTHQHLRPQVMPYAKSIVDISTLEAAGLSLTNLPVILLLVLVCGNVALLMFARAATRETEMVVRTALGATRARVIMQLFAEALVLGGIAAVIGLAAAGYGIRWVIALVEMEFLEGGKLPFWVRDSLSPATFAYAIALTVLGAIIAGVLPALKVTRGMGARLQQVSAGGGGMRFGGVWTAVIIAQVAVTVAFPAVTYFVRHDAVKIRAIDVGLPAQEYLSARVEIDREPMSAVPADTSRAAFVDRFRATYEELEQRLEADPAVAAVTFADRLPLMYHPHRIIELDEGGAAPLHPEYPNGYRVSDAHVDAGYFKATDTPILAGRDFHAGDLEANATPVIVNQSFVSRVLGERNPIGRRIRYIYLEESARPLAVADRGPWYEIVGVVRDMGMASVTDPKISGIYHPAAPGTVSPAQVAVHVKGNPEAFTPRLRAIAAEVDPTMRLYDIKPLDQGSLSELEFIKFWFRLLVATSLVALLLSLAGIYAVMSFTVAKRTREIGIRVALGASRRRVITAIFARPITQVALGIAAGVGILVGLTRMGNSQPIQLKMLGAFAVYAVFMMGVCMLACVIPTRKALSVEPTEALRSDG